MARYSITINENEICTINGTEAAWDAFYNARVFCESVGATCELIDDETGDVLDSFDEDDYLDDEELDDFDEEDLEEGFDPYEGCYTFDC